MFNLNRRLGRCNFTMILSFCSSEVQLRSVNHAQPGPIPGSYLFIEGQDMMFVCNGTPINRGVLWVVQLTGIVTATGTFSLARDQARINSSATDNDANPADLTVLGAMLGDSNTTVTCKDNLNGNMADDTLTIFVEGEYQL